MQIAPVITLRDSTITANYSNGVTDYNSNGLYIENTVIQATGPWQVYSANSTGNYQGAYLKNIYSESSLALNPLSPPHSPFPGLGIAGLIASFQIEGTGARWERLQRGGLVRRRIHTSSSSTTRVRERRALRCEFSIGPPPGAIQFRFVGRGWQTELTLLPMTYFV